jgi:hypothetical protein
MSDNPPSA